MLFLFTVRNAARCEHPADLPEYDADSSCSGRGRRDGEDHRDGRGRHADTQGRAGRACRDGAGGYQLLFSNLHASPTENQVEFVHFGLLLHHPFRIYHQHNPTHPPKKKMKRVVFFFRESLA